MLNYFKLKQKDVFNNIRIIIVLGLALFGAGLLNLRSTLPVKAVAHNISNINYDGEVKRIGGPVKINIPPEIASNSINYQVLDPFGQVADVDISIEGSWPLQEIEISPKGNTDQQPGKYQIIATSAADGTKLYSQSFAWGVLAFNPDYAIYPKDTPAKLSFAVLDDYGRTICDAELNLKITDPEGKVSELSTNDSSIRVNESCSRYQKETTPDYEADFNPEVAGDYQVELVAQSNGAVRTLTDKFSMDPNAKIYLQRVGPTRTYPPVTYDYELKLFTVDAGKYRVTEKVPSSFEVTPDDNGTLDSSSSTITWDLESEANSTTTLAYQFKTPNISPYLFNLGAAEVTSETSEAWTEPRLWQIASDATCTSQAGGGGLWNNALSWSCGHVPVDGDDAVIAAAQAITLDVDTAQLNTLTINASANLNGGSYTINLAGTANTFIRNGTFTYQTSTVSYNHATSATVLAMTGTGGTNGYYNLQTNGAGTYTLGGATVVNNNLSILAGTFDVSGSSYSLTITGSYANSGTLNARSGRVTFNATSAGKTLSGTLNGTSSFYKVTFNGVSGGWTINNPMKVSAANATDTLLVYNGTVTIGNGNNDSLEINGKTVIAPTAGQVATLETMSGLAAGSYVYLDVNNNAAPANCSNCMISVGATGGGTALLKINANAVLRLNTDNTNSNTYVQVESTGKFQMLGTLGDSGTSASANDTTLTDITKSWTANAEAGKYLRMKSGLAKGLVYPITSNNATTLTYTGTESANFTYTYSGSSSSKLVCSNSNTLITADMEDIGKYLHDKTSDTYYIIRSSVNNDPDCSNMDSFTIVADPGSFSSLSNGHTANFSDGVQDGDEYEVEQLANLTAKSGIACSSGYYHTRDAYFYAKAGSETVIQYAQVCNLGNNFSTRTGLVFSGVNGANANEGVTIDHLWAHENIYSIYFTLSNNNNTTNSKGISNCTFTHNNGGGIDFDSDPDGPSNNNSAVSNTASFNDAHGIGSWGGDNNIFTSNIAHGNFYNGLIANSDNNILISNDSSANGSDGVLVEGVGNTFISNSFNANNSFGIEVYNNDLTTPTNNTFNSNNISNSKIYGLYDMGTVTTSINDQFGTSGANEAGDLYRSAINSRATYLYGSKFSTASSLIGGYTLASGKTPSDVVGATADGWNNSRAAVFYNDGTYSVSTKDLLYDYGPFKPMATYNYTVAAGKTPSQIVGVTGEDWNTGRIAFFYDDGTYSATTDEWLGEGDIDAPNLYNYTLAAGYTTADIIGVEQDSMVTGKLAVFYDDGVYSVAIDDSWDASADVSLPDEHNFTLAAGKTTSQVLDMSNNGYWTEQLAVWYNDYTYSNSAGSWSADADIASAVLYDSSVQGAIISKKDNDNNGVAKVWGKYSIPSAVTETPQSEEIDSYNYANNLYEKSATAHNYSGTGTEDTNLNYDLSSASLSSGPYSYYAKATDATHFEVYRNGVDVAAATVGSEFTDPTTSVKFKIDGGAPTAYVAGDTYSFTVWDASGDTNAQKNLTLNQDGDSYTVPAGTTLNLQGQDVGTNVSTVSHGSTGGYNFIVQGTINASNYQFDYLGSTNSAIGLDLRSGSTVTNLAGGTFAHFNVADSSSTYMKVDGSLIGSGSPSKTFTNTSFTQVASTQPKYTVTESGGTPISGNYWLFDNSVVCSGWSGCESSDSDTGDGLLLLNDNGYIRFGINLWNLRQQRADGTTISEGEWIGTTQINYLATAESPTSQTLYLCVEAKPIGTAFTNQEDSCGAGVLYAGTPVNLQATIADQAAQLQYHWQARIKDESGNYSSWVSFGNGTAYGINSELYPTVLPVVGADIY